jgi:uncharacterized phosphatase
MTALALVRHGRTRWNLERRLQGRSDLALDEVGEREALAAARTLSAWEWAHVISSPLTRARETARIIANELGTTLPTVDDGLLERDFGLAEGFTVHEAQRLWPAGDYPLAEGTAALAERTRGALERLSALTEPTVIVGHGAFLRTGIEAMTGEGFPRLLNGDVVLVSSPRSAGKNRTFHLLAR